MRRSSADQNRCDVVGVRTEIQDKRARDVFCREPDRGSAVDRVRGCGRDRECQVVAEAFNRFTALGGHCQRHTGFGIGLFRGSILSAAAADKEQNDYYYDLREFSRELNGFNGLKSAEFVHSAAEPLFTYAHSETIA